MNPLRLHHAVLFAAISLTALRATCASDNPWGGRYEPLGMPTGGSIYMATSRRTTRGC